MATDPLAAANFVDFDNELMDDDGADDLMDDDDY